MGKPPTPRPIPNALPVNCPDNNAVMGVSVNKCIVACPIVSVVALLLLLLLEALSVLELEPVGTGAGTGAEARAGAFASVSLTRNSKSFRVSLSSTSRELTKSSNEAELSGFSLRSFSHVSSKRNLNFLRSSSSQWASETLSEMPTCEN